MATHAGKLIVEVVDARDLAPKDGHGTSSPYAVVDYYYGQRKKTKTMIHDLNPVWNETLEFNVGKPSEVLGDMLELHVFHDKNIGPTTRNNFLGRVRLSSRQFVKKGEEALIYYPLEKKNLLSWIQGEIGLKIYFVDDEAVPPPAPPPPPPPPKEKEPKHEQTEAPTATLAPEAATKPPAESEGPKSDAADTLHPLKEKETHEAAVVEAELTAGQQEGDKVIPNTDQQEEKHDGNMEQMMASMAASRTVPEQVKVNNITKTYCRSEV